MNSNSANNIIHGSVPDSSPIPSEAKQPQPIQHRFISIDEECPPSSERALQVLLPHYPFSASSITIAPVLPSAPCFALLQRFYDELMVPAFPLEKERDDVEDWFECFRDQMKLRRHKIRVQHQEVKEVLTEGFQEEGVATLVQRLANATENDEVDEDSDCDFEGPAMDVIIMVQGGAKEDGVPGLDQNDYVIIGGAAVEYYKQSRVGLLSYLVLGDKFRGCGLAQPLHAEALARLDDLARCHGTAPAPEERGAPSAPVAEGALPPPAGGEASRPRRTPLLRAVFAETNTAAAGDVTPEQSLRRHRSLRRLGYRLVKFPYAQPPLSTEDVNASFDDIVLLVYFPFDSTCDIERQQVLTDREEGALAEREVIQRYCPWFLEEPRRHDESDGHGNTVRMNINIPFEYIIDFYQSVFGYGLKGAARHLESALEGIPDFRTASYYSLAHWFTHSRRIDTAGVDVCLCSSMPFQDCKGDLMPQWKEWQESTQHNAR